MKGFGIFLMFLVFFLVICGTSWICTCGIIKLITLCFGLRFTWKIATGIWLILFLITGGFTVKRNNE